MSYVTHLLLFRTRARAQCPRSGLLLLRHTFEVSRLLVVVPGLNSGGQDSLVLKKFSPSRWLAGITVSRITFVVDPLTDTMSDGMGTCHVCVPRSLGDAPHLANARISTLMGVVKTCVTLNMLRPSRSHEHSSQLSPACGHSSMSRRGGEWSGMWCLLPVSARVLHGLEDRPETF